MIPGRKPIMDRPDHPDDYVVPMTDEERIEAFRAAVQVGLDDSAAGRVRRFENFDALADFVRAKLRGTIAEPTR